MTKHIVYLTAILALTATLRADLKPSTRIVEQPNAPVKINEYSAAYHGESRYQTTGIHHDVTFSNATDKPIVAIQFGLVAFDVWNRFLDRTNGLTIQDLGPGGTLDKPKTANWVARGYADFSFLTGVSYVNRVRFADGTIWVADENAVIAELRKIESDFDAANLKEKKESPKE